MTMHAWAEHVVHVELLSGDAEIAETTVRFLERRFSDRDVEGHAEPGRIGLHSDLARPVSAEDVARALVEAGVRAHAVHERQEWSVTDA